MQLLALLVLVVSTLWLALFRRRGAGASWSVLVCLYVVLGALAGEQLWARQRREREQDLTSLRERLPTQSRPGGYVSSDHCRGCHPAEHQTWHRSYHRTMTQEATPQTVKARFDDVTLEHEGSRYQLSREGDAYQVSINDGPKQRVAMVTGSHHMQVFWLPGALGNQQVEFPFTYLLQDKRWVKRRDVFLIDPQFQKVQSIWNTSCIECHATGGQPGLQPPPHAEGTASPAGAVAPQTRVGELGIACEACHGPGYRHVVANTNPVRRFAQHLAGKGDPTIVNPARLPPPAAAQVCGQCHSVGCNLKGWTWAGLPYVPGQDLEKLKPMIRSAQVETSACRDLIAQDPTFVDSRYWKDGMVRVSGREYSSLIESRCFASGDLSCGSCHSMHKGDPDGQLEPPMRGEKACLQCHPALARDVPAHTHHAAGSPGNNCYNCHMPRTTYGLMKALSSHQIDSPSVQKTLETGRPNACNLCHTDKTLAWTAKTLAEWYKTPAPALSPAQAELSAAVRDVLAGDAGQRAITAWTLGWPESQKAAGSDWQAPFLAELLVDPYPAVRYVAFQSLRKLPGFADLAYDYVGPEVVRAQVKQEVLKRWKAARRGAPTSSAALLLTPAGEPRRDAWDELLRRRDDKGMFLAE